MYEELYEPIPDIKMYLTRLHLDNVTPNLDGLNSVIKAHLVHIPYDDMDVWGAGLCPSLAVNDLFEKIIVNRRGGYCFELNCILFALLKSLGFDVYMVTARIMEDRGFRAPASHCAIICTIEGQKYFCDVGYGGPGPFGAVALDGKEYWGYRVVKDNGIYSLKSTSGYPFETILEFEDAPRNVVDFVAPNFYISQIQSSKFKALLIVNRRLEDGTVYSILQNEFKIHSPSGKSTVIIKDIGHLKRILKEYYGIEEDTLHLPDESSIF